MIMLSNRSQALQPRLTKRFKLVSHAQIIELHGKHYDATTGQAIAKPAHSSKAASPSLPLPAAAEVKKSITGRPTKHPLQPHKPERARTLMRSIVKKPKVPPAKTTSHPRPVFYGSLTLQRQRRAKTINKSPLVSHFGQTTPKFHKKTAVLPVQPAPTPLAKTHTKPAGSLGQPKPIIVKHHSQLTQASAPEDTIRHALEQATSHQAHRLKKRRVHQRAAHRFGISPGALNTGAACLAGILLFGFVAYQNATSLAMHVASARAGFEAHLPHYEPAGFKLSGPINASSGLISLRFQSTTDNRSFALTQQPSTWTSQALLSNFVSRRPHYTYNHDGQVVYIYDQFNATWVNNGVWYKLEGNSALNSDQLLHIANSI